MIVVAVAACRTAGSPPHALRVGPGLAAMLAVADETRAPWRCSEARELAPDATFGEWALRGGTVRRPDTELKPLTIGIVADAAGPDPKTIAALSNLRASFERANVDLVVSLGGMGSTKAEISATVGALVGRWPIVALPGDLESTSAHVGAVAELLERGAAVVDGRGVRSIETQNAMLSVIPGVGSAYRSVAGRDSCVWTPTDVAETHRELSAFPGLRIAVSAEAPRGIVDGEATGEVALVPQVPIDVVVHAPTQAAPTPGTRGERDSARVGLSPGSADATTRLPPSLNPTAGLLIIRERMWEWRAIFESAGAVSR